MELKIPPPLQAVIAALLMWVLSSNTSLLSFQFGGQNVFALIFVVLGIITAVMAALHFRSVETTVNPFKPAQATHLVQTGIFRVSRNPMYLGLLLVLVGLFFHFGNFINALIVVVFLLYITQFQIMPEERALEKLFDQRYRDYKQLVRRWI